MPWYLIIILIGLTLTFPLVVYAELRKRNASKISARRISRQIGFRFHDEALNFDQVLAEKGQDYPVQGVARKRPGRRFQQISKSFLASIVYMSAAWKMTGSYKGSDAEIELRYFTEEQDQPALVCFSIKLDSPAPCDLLLHRRGYPPEQIPEHLSRVEAIPAEYRKQVVLLTSNEPFALGWLSQSNLWKPLVSMSSLYPRARLSRDRVEICVLADQLEFTEKSFREYLSTLASAIRQIT